MKTLNFKYTKADGSISERTILALVEPGGDKYAGIDLTMMEPSDAATFVREVTALHDGYVDQLKGLQAAFDLKHNYRQFLASGVSEIIEI